MYISGGLGIGHCRAELEDIVENGDAWGKVVGRKAELCKDTDPVDIGFPLADSLPKRSTFHGRGGPIPL